jgi:predicted metal-dependent HD superfamily phosphohydrolase
MDTMHARFSQLCIRLGHAQEADPWFAILDALHAHPVRVYHNLIHIGECLDELDRCRALATDPDLVEVAIWTHDCIYVPGRKDNEARSAQIGSRLADALRPSASSASRTTSWNGEAVRQLIMATLHTPDPLDGDAALIADIDLSGLALPWEQFAAKSALIRQEFSFVPDEAYRQGRSAFLQSMLSRERIFRLPWFTDRYEAAARENLTKSIEMLKASD